MVKTGGKGKIICLVMALCASLYTSGNDTHCQNPEGIVLSYFVLVISTRILMNYTDMIRNVCKLMISRGLL